VSVHLAVRDELDMLVIDSLRPRSVVISSRIDVGTRMAIATSAAGRAYLAALPGPSRRCCWSRSAWKAARTGAPSSRA
jgi:DNA-binding IclR family transcriptional regulator